MRLIDVCCALIEETSGATPMLWTAQKPPSSHLAGLWEFPGGKIEQSETGEQAIVREIQEELGIRIHVSGKLPPVIHDYGTHCIRLIPFICEREKDEPLPSPLEHSALALLTLSRFDDIKLAPADAPIFISYKATKSHSS